MRFYILSSVILLSCSSAQNQNVVTKVEVNRNSEPVTYYYDGDKLISVVRKSTSTSVDSSAIRYSNDNEAKVYWYKNDGSGMKPAKVDDDDNSTMAESGINIENCSQSIKFGDKFGLLEDDFCYLNLLLPMLASDLENKKSADTISYTLDKDIGQLQGKGFSPFVSGTIARKVTLIVEDSMLMRIYASFYDEPSTQTINYEKVYEYNKDGTIKKSITTNISTNEVEDSTYYKYSKISLR